MIKKITAGLLAVTLLAACQTTKTTQRTTLRDLNATRLAAADTNLNDPAPPAEGPEDIPAEGPRDPVRNPALVPTPLLRINAASSP